jgi:DNA-binding NtrC family response regulator
VIIVVDDDPVFLEKAETGLAPVSEGGVFFAGNAKDALELLGSMGTGLSVALIDLDLPQVNGFDLISKVRKEFPHVSVIAISGVCSPAVLEAAKLFGAADVLSKPITREWNETVERVRDFDHNRH